MSKLRRSFSQRCKRKSYSTLQVELDMFKTPPNKLTPAKEYLKSQPKQHFKFNFNAGSGGDHTDTLSVCNGAACNAKARESSTPISRSSTSKTSSSNSKEKSGFVGMANVKSAIANIGQKLRSRKTSKSFKQIKDSPSMVNAAYTTPRRSERLKIKNSPSPITLKMYTPFHIETPDLEDSFTYISKRKALSDLNESPMNKTPRRMTKQAINHHKEFAKSLSSTAIKTTSGY